MESWDCSQTSFYLTASRADYYSRGHSFIFSLNQGRLPFRNSCPAVWLNLAHKSKNCLALFIRLALPCSALRCFANGDLSQLLQSLESFLCNWSQPELEAKIYKLLSAAKWCLHTNSLTCPCNSRQREPVRTQKQPSLFNVHQQ